MNKKSSNNVILFPAHKITQLAPPQTIEDVNDRILNVQHFHIQETIDFVAPMLFEQLSVAGFDVEHDMESIKDGAMLVEGIRSFLCKILGIEHPIQLISDKMFDLNDDFEISGVDGLTIVITSPEENVYEDLQWEFTF
jgi:hypothetical protein